MRSSVAYKNYNNLLWLQLSGFLMLLWIFWSRNQDFRIIIGTIQSTTTPLLQNNFIFLKNTFGE